MLSLQSLNPRGHRLTPEQTANQERLLAALKELESAFGKPLVVTCGVRSWSEHESIYKRLGRKPPKGSAHLIVTGEGKPGLCAAADIWDQDKSLWKFLAADIDRAHKDARPSLVERLGLYLEDGSFTPNWVHVQLNAPASGNRIFIPFAQVSKPSAR